MSQSIAPLMPARGERGAPQFDPVKPHGLRCFFADLDFQFTRSQVVDEEERKGHALRFVNCDTAELWEILPEFADITVPYRKFVDAVFQLYPGSDAEERWLRADMETLVEDTLRSGISSLADLGKYYRDFVAITTFLIAKNRLAATEQSRTFARTFPSELWRQVSRRLQLKFPDHFPDNPYTLEQIHDAARFVLHGTAASTSACDRPLPLPLTLAPAAKTEPTKLSIFVDTLKLFVATLGNQSKPSPPASSLLVSTPPPPLPPVPSFQLSPQERIQEIEKELSALRSQVRLREQAALKPPAAPAPFVPAPISAPVPMPAPKGRRNAWMTPDCDDTPRVVFVSSPATSTLKAAHGPVFSSGHASSDTADVAIFALAPSASVHVSKLVPKCIATAEHPTVTARSISVLTVPSCAFAGAENPLAAAHADGIVSVTVKTFDHPARSVSAPAIPSRALAGAESSLAVAHADGIVSAIVPLRIPITAANLSPISLPTNVDRKSATAFALAVAIAHPALASVPAAPPMFPLATTIDFDSVPTFVPTPPSVPTAISTSVPIVSFDFPITPDVSISEPAVFLDSVATPVFASAPAPLLTCSPPAARLPVPMVTSSPKTTDLIFETPTPTFVPQLAPSATLGSDVTCHTLRMVFDPGINFRMDSATSIIHVYPVVSFLLFQFALILLFVFFVVFAATVAAPHFILRLRSHNIFLTSACLALHTPSSSRRDVTEDSHYFS